MNDVETMRAGEGIGEMGRACERRRVRAQSSALGSACNSHARMYGASVRVFAEFDRTDAEWMVEAGEHRGFALKAACCAGFGTVATQAGRPEAAIALGVDRPLTRHSRWVGPANEGHKRAHGGDTSTASPRR